MASAGSIVVTRDTAPWRDRARGYKLLIDGSVVSRLAQGETFTCPVEPGTHSVQMKIDWASSPRIDCLVEADKSVHLIAPGGSAFSAAALLMVLRPGSHVRLEIRADS
jgi:hypothetical protein